MKKIFFSHTKLLLVVFTLLLFSCEKSFVNSDIETTTEELNLKSAKIKTPEVSFNIVEAMPAALSGEFSTTFIAGQNYEAGNVDIANTAGKLYIAITMNEGWQLNCTHLFIGDFEDIPINNGGNIKTGNFPFCSCFKKGTNEVIYEFDRADFNDTVTILVHGEVSGISSETAWAYGTELENANRWAWYIDYTMGNIVTPR